MDQGGKYAKLVDLKETLLVGQHQKQSLSASLAVVLDSPRVRDMYKGADWWSVWVGFVYLFVCLLMQHVFGAKESDIPEPGKWTHNILTSIEAADMFRLEKKSFARGLLGLLWWSIAMAVPVCVSSSFLGLAPRKVLPAFMFNYMVSCVALLLGAHSKLGLYATSTVWGLLFGLLCVNVIGQRFPAFLDFLKPSSSQGELYIKIGLVLMCVELATLFAYGLPAVIVSWGVTPFVILFAWQVGALYVFLCSAAPLP
eukprot:c10339_g1_i2.p1 GENE.c10339_g1_i2~~c10339_g1_i2.p1  ORF type:complete len:255 (+),score=60.84 c10339_g1_i2:328-1092(+)